MNKIIKRNLVTSLLIPALMGFYTVTGCTSSQNNQSFQRSTYQQEQIEQAEQEQIAERPFKTAEKYHLDAKFEDARSWYVMVVEDFPNSPQAAEAAVRVFNIDLALCMQEILKISAELQISTEKLVEMGQYQSREFQRRYFREADAHAQQIREAADRYENNVRELAENYDVLLERYLDDYISELWLIPEIPTASEAENLTSEDYLEILSEQGFAFDVSDYLFLSGPEMRLKMYSDFEPFWLKFNYNTRVNEISTDGRLDEDKVRFVVGTAFYNSENLHERGVSELEELIASIEDPYSEIKYEAEKVLEGTSLLQMSEEGFQAFEELRRLLGL